MRRSLVLSLFLGLLLTVSCGKKKSSPYEIGIDPSWYPLQLGSQDERVLVFSLELLQEIAKREHLPLAIVRRSWDNLLWGLAEKKYPAVLSSMRPYTFYCDKYSFSNLYLKTGPVIVVGKNSKISTVEDLSMRRVAVVRGSSAALLLQKTPGVLLQGFDSIALCLQALANRDVHAAAIEVLVAQNFVNDFYKDSLKLVSEPLTNEGLRLLTLHNATPDLMRRFNRGLAEMKQNGAYDKLLEKWGLSPDKEPIVHLDQKIQAFLQQTF